MPDKVKLPHDGQGGWREVSIICQIGKVWHYSLRPESCRVPAGASPVRRPPGATRSPVIDHAFFFSGEEARTTQSPPSTGARAPFGLRFWLVWVAGAVSFLGDGVIFGALPLLALRATHDPRLIALIEAFSGVG